MTMLFWGADKDRKMTAELFQVNKGDGKKVTALGVGVGALGTAAGTVCGAVCPLCFVVTPVLIGTGIWVQRVENSRGEQSIAFSQPLATSSERSSHGCYARKKLCSWPRIVLLLCAVLCAAMMEAVAYYFF